MPILENMTKEGFLIPSPTKHTTSWSSSNGNVATVKEVIVGGVVCHEIAPPTISPVLPFAKKQPATPVKEPVPQTDIKDEDDVPLTIVAKSAKADAMPEEKLAIQAPDVSSTEEYSGTERDMQDEGGKESHVTSSRPCTQDKDSGNNDNAGDKDMAEGDVALNSGEIAAEHSSSPMEENSPDVDEGDEKTTSEEGTDAKPKKGVSKKGNRRKPVYKCHVCGATFGKPVHVKIHIAKKHGLQARKSASKMKVFVPKKREKIRTRSVSTREKVVDHVGHREQHDIEKKEVKETGDAVKDDKKVEKIIKKVKESLEDVPEEKDISFSEEMEAEKDLEKPQFSDRMMNSSASMIPMMYSSLAYGHREGKSCGTYQCEFCHRVFRYRTWLNKHQELKHPGKTPTIVYEETKPKKKSEPTPPPAHPVNEEKVVEDLKSEELTPEQIEILKAQGKGKRLKIFPCSLCGRRFSSKTNVRRHKRLIHKILVRPRRTRLPYPEYTVEEEEKPKPKKSTDAQKQAKVTKVPSPQHSPVASTNNSETVQNVPSPITGMRKPRKNKSPLKRSRGIHNQEAFAESYLTFPIEANPNPLSAFMPTKPETLAMESAVYKNKESYQRGFLAGTAALMKQSPPSSLPSAMSPPMDSSRRTGPPPSASPANKTSTTLPEPEKVQVTELSTQLGMGSARPAEIPSIHRRKPSTVTHLGKPAVPFSDAAKSSEASKPSHPPAMMPQTVYNTQVNVNPFQSKQRPLLSTPSMDNSATNGQTIIKSSDKRLQFEKPISTNPWVCARKPQPFVPRKPKQEQTPGEKEKINVKMTQFETPVTQSLSATHQKLETMSVLNLKRKVPTPPPPPPMSEDGVLDLTVRKRPRINPPPSPIPSPPAKMIPSEPVDPNLPLDLSSGSKGPSRQNHSVAALNPAQSHVTNAMNKFPDESTNYANLSAQRYEFHHMSPASFGGKEHGAMRKQEQKKKSIHQMIQEKDALLLKVADKDSHVQQPRMQLPIPMQPKSYRPLLPKSSQSSLTTPQPSLPIPSVPEQATSPQASQAIHTSPPASQAMQPQISPHLVAAQVIKQAHAQSTLRPILPKPPPGASTPVYIGGKVVAAGSPPQRKQQDLTKRHSPSHLLDANGFSCNVCDVAFSSIKALAKHVVVHANEWPYKCEFCVRLYQDTDELIQHRTQLHHVGKTFSCGVCKRGFAYKSNLKKHQADVHNLTEMNYRELGPKELRAHNFTDPAKIKTGPPELPSKPKPERPSFIQQEMNKTVKIGKLKLPLKQRSATPSPTRSTPSPRKSGPINPQRHHPFAYARQIGYLNMLNDPRNQEVLQAVSTHRCTKCSKEFTETAEFHGHIMECALEGMDKMEPSNKEKEKSIDAEKHAKEVSEKKMKMKAYTKSKKKAIQLRQSTPGKRQRAKPGLKIYNPKKYTRRRSSASVDDVHACPGCDKKFYFINKLERHMRMCPNREKFRNKGKKVVTESGDGDILKKGHCCPFCTRQFTYLKSLKKHALTCPARNPDEVEDPIKLIDENYQNACKMAEEKHDGSTDTKPTKANASTGESSKLAKSQRAASVADGKKRRRRRKRTDVIPRPKKRKRVVGSIDSQDSSSPRKLGPKRNRLVVKMAQKAPPAKKQETPVSKPDPGVKRKLPTNEEENQASKRPAIDAKKVEINAKKPETDTKTIVTDVKNPVADEKAAMAADLKKAATEDSVAAAVKAALKMANDKARATKISETQKHDTDQSSSVTKKVQSGDKAAQMSPNVQEHKQDNYEGEKKGTEYSTVGNQSRQDMEERPKVKENSAPINGVSVSTDKTTAENDSANPSTVVPNYSANQSTTHQIVTIADKNQNPSELKLNANQNSTKMLEPNGNVPNGTTTVNVNGQFDRTDVLQDINAYAGDRRP